MRPIDIAGFEAKYRADPDPWNYRTSRFEAVKRRLLIHACGLRPVGRALELACSNGETTRHLAPRCLRLLAVDASAATLEEAARRTHPSDRLILRQALLPAEMPRGPFDLIVASEIAYYLDANALRILASRIAGALAPGGRVVALHHTRPFDDAAQPPMQAQVRLRAAFGRSMSLVLSRRYRNVDAAAFRKPQGPCPGRGQG